MLQILEGISFTGHPDDVDTIKHHLEPYVQRFPIPQLSHHPWVFVGGGQGTPTAARSIRRVGVIGFTMIANTSDRSRDRDFAPIGAGFLKEIRGCIDWADILRQSLYATPQEGWGPWQELLEPKVAGTRKGYLVLQALAELLGGVQEAIDLLNFLMGNPYRVVAPAVEPTDIFFRLGDKTLNLHQYGWRDDPSQLPDGVFLEPAVSLAPVAAEALGLAEVVVIGPGDVHFSVLPPFLVEGFTEALAANKRAQLILVANLTSRDIDIYGFRLHDFLDLWNLYLPVGREVHVLVNTAPLVEVGSGAVPLEDDIRGNKYGWFSLHRKVLASESLTSNRQLKHDEAKLGPALVSLVS